MRLFFVVCFALFVTAQSKSCVSPDVNGTSIDITPLSYDPTQTPPDGYSYYSATDGNTLYVNFCEQVASSINDACNKNAPNGACQQSGTSYFASGTVESMIWLDYVSDGTYTQGTGVKYSNGDYCKSFNTNRNTAIYVSCDTSAGLGKLYSESANGCDYTVYFASEYGCPGAGGSGGVNPGWIIIFICCILFFVYVVVGIAFKAVKQGARGLEVIPNVDFWKGFPILVKEGCIFFVYMISCRKACGGYSQI